ncbi:MAG: peptidoglycan-binding domain-containing protein [Azospirillaceae bacterium]
MAAPTAFASPVPPPIATLAAAAAIALGGLLASADPAAAQRQDGSYDYVGESWQGTMLVETDSDGYTYFDIYNRNPPLTCGAFGRAEARDDRLTWTDPTNGARLVIRFFEDNAEVEATDGLPRGCGLRGQIAGIYLATEEAPDLDRDQVRRLQSSLDKLGFDPGPVDGVMGPQTRDALNDFQADAGRRETRAPALADLWAAERALAAATAGVAGTTGGADQTGAPPKPGEKPVPPAAQTVEPAWTTDIPQAFHGWLDRIYGEQVAPANIDFANPPFEVALVDLDGRPGSGPNQTEVLVLWNDRAFCGESGCAFDVLRYDGNAYEPVLESTAERVALGAGYTNGLRNLVVDGRVLTWDGETYEAPLYEPEPVR